MTPKGSIKRRLVCSLLALIVAISVAILVAFNISVQNYIDNNARREIESAREMILSPERIMPRENPSAPEIEKRLEGKGPNPLGAEVHGFWLSGDQMVPSGPEDDEEIEAQILENLNIEDAFHSVQTVTTDMGTFLVLAVRREMQPDTAMVLYVDITAMRNFAARTNMLLIIILIAVGSAAVAVAFALAASIARPIQQISRFARNIGENDFTPVHLHLRDRETADLLAVMNQAAGKLAAYDSEQKTFFQNVSHELKTPLMGIQCNAEGIICHVMPPEDAGSKILQETDRLRDMVDELMFVSKMDTITESEILEERDLREILSNSAESQSAAASQKNLEIIYEFSAVPVYVAVSEKNMQRAFSNLISNAIRYARSRIVLACFEENGEAVASVWNDGPPISEKDLPHIYERFYKGAGGQSGIGLAIVKSVVSRCGGEIQTDSTPEGTRFTVRLRALSGEVPSLK